MSMNTIFAFHANLIYSHKKTNLVFRISICKYYSLYIHWLCGCFCIYYLLCMFGWETV